MGLLYVGLPWRRWVKIESRRGRSVCGSLIFNCKEDSDSKLENVISLKP